ATRCCAKGTTTAPSQNTARRCGSSPTTSIARRRWSGRSDSRRRRVRSLSRGGGRLGLAGGLRRGTGLLPVAQRFAPEDVAEGIKVFLLQLGVAEVADTDGHGRFGRRAGVVAAHEQDRGRATVG